ncbi:Oidioi.mRNA.OKI2018_I69.PAR.g11886.t1.cds [Oikopleura dioica]|uniref:Oidioi.mRNA.OKI2018_I69.PAR.g11886.t1.cds n=1 Tax=Oikopleura dioica TaxID=34765 RepID=A0ABN7RYE1_OIKDI|nr:Oidioi.mRNA.OKI2018_I69.PAR.g11886.t1.cds [Oikopleura dioica]
MATIPTTIRSIDLAFGIDRILGLSTEYNLPLPNTSEKKSSRSRKRTVFSKFQLEQLEIAFNKCQYLVGQERHNLASQLGLEINTVKVWFQNRRIRLRKASPNTKANSVGSASDSE